MNLPLKSPSRNSRSEPFPSKLDAKQIGSLRHIENIAGQLDGEWTLMGGRCGLQEDFGAFRYQLAYAGVALALAHYHRLPNAPGVFKPIFENLIRKMMHPGVWMYWHFVSQGGALTNGHLWGKVPAQWDPVKKDNIMFSAYLTLLPMLYTYLFDDDRYAQPGALTMSINPLTFGDRMDFSYDQHTLSDTIYWQMVQNGYLGVACEPSCVFQICNQPSILAFRVEDFIKGTSRAQEVTEGYLNAWKEFGMLDPGGHFMVHVVTDLKIPIPNALPWLWSDAWLAALMHSWNPEFVHQHYPPMLERFLIPGPDDTCAIRLWEPVDVRGVKTTADTADFGWAAVAAAELGDVKTLLGLFGHADRFMNPQWRDGGLHYPRNDMRYDDQGVLRLVEPITSNTLLPYARLNVPNGLHTFYHQPWTRAHFEEPLLTEISHNLDVLEARFDPIDAALRFTLAARHDRPGDGEITIASVFEKGRGAWKLYRAGVECATGDNDHIARADGLGIERDADAMKLVMPRDGQTAFTLVWA